MKMKGFEKIKMKWFGKTWKKETGDEKIKDEMV